jgi:ubiquitin conjugation factor E4 B
MAQSAPGIEKNTLLGPFFRISPLQPEVCKEYFSGPQRMDKRAVHVAQESLRLTLQTHQNDLNQITNYFIRASANSRNRTLDWFAYIVNANHKRRAMRPDATQLSSDGFLINVTYVLDCLCQPFMDSTFSKMSKIETEYLRRKPRVDIKPETKLNADQTASDEYYNVEESGTSNFISEVFFLTLAAHHYGTEASNAMLKGLEKDVKYLQDQMVKLEGERSRIVSFKVLYRSRKYY